MATALASILFITTKCQGNLTVGSLKMMAVIVSGMGNGMTKSKQCPGTLSIFPTLALAAKSSKPLNPMGKLKQRFLLKTRMEHHCLKLMEQK